MDYGVQWQEHQDYEANRLSESDFDRAEAQMGARWNGDVTSEWLLTSRDVWVPNPSYQGPRCPVHPEQDPDDCYPEVMDKYLEEYALFIIHLEEAERLSPLATMEELWPERYVH